MEWYQPTWQVIHGISIYDVLMLPIYIAVLSMFALWLKYVRYKDTNEGRYLVRALVFKLFCGIVFAAIYYYYYQGGDTFWYYLSGQPFRQAFRDNPFIGLSLLGMKPGTYSQETIEYTSEIWTIWFHRQDSETVFMAKIIGLIEAVTFPSYWLTTIFFSAFSFSGTWALYRVFAKRYHSKRFYLAISILFVPSALFWGSGILKDTICLGALGWCLYGIDRALSEGHSRTSKYLPLSIFMGFVILRLKAYIILSFLPPLFLWFFMRFRPSPQIAILKYSLLPILFGIFLLSTNFIVTNLAETTAKYNPATLEKRAEGFRTYHTYLAKEKGQSYYNLGEISYTPLGLLSAAPKAINVTYFRPYLWEVGEPLQYLSAIESLAFLFFVLYCIRRCGLKGILSSVFRNPEVALCISYALLFGFAVGLTAYNFGALVRFKVPGVPFFLTSLLLILQDKSTNESVSATAAEI